MADSEQGSVDDLPQQPAQAGGARWLKGARVAATLLLVLCLVVAAQWLTDPSVSPLRLARIEGDLKYLKRTELEQAVADTLRDSFFSVDVQAVKAAAEALPWVAQVSVRRVWPDTLHIWVVEQVPLARWGDKALINSRGEVFRPSLASIPSDLPLLNGPEGSGPELVAYYQRAQVLLRGIDMRVTQLHMSARRGWSLETQSGIAVNLGRDAFDQRLARWVELYPRLRDSRPEQMLRVDMRYHNGMVVLWDRQPGGEKTAS